MSTTTEARLNKLTTAIVRAAELEHGVGLEAFQQYVTELSVVAKANEKWSAAHSKGARGKLSGHWSTTRATLDETRAVLTALGVDRDYAIDVAADPGSAVAPDWFGLFHMDPARRDALAPTASWASFKGPSWLNAPYGTIEQFAKRAAGYDGVYPLAFLAFARTDTKWFQNHVLFAARSIWFRLGRISFIDPTTGQTGKNKVAPAPSMLATFGGGALPAGLRPGDRVGRWALVYVKNT